MEENEKCTHDLEIMNIYPDDTIGEIICKICKKSIGARVVRGAYDDKPLIEVDKSKEFIIKELKKLAGGKFEFITREDGYINLWEKETKEKESCNNLHSIFTFVTEGLICSKCHTLLAIEIDSKFYWNIFDLKARELIKENVSLANLFKEWSSFKKSSSIDQTSLINNQIQKIAAQEAEIKRLQKIIINQAEIIGNKSNG